MSRIGKLPVAFPSAVSVTIGEDNLVTVKGPKGELTQKFNEDMEIKLEGSTVVVTRSTDDKKHRALHGLTRAVIANMVQGVTQGFSKELEIVGVGFRAQLNGKKLTLSVGFTHPVEFEAAPDIEFETPTQTQIIVKGPDKQKVGQVAAIIRSAKPPEPYKGTGIRYKGEYVIRKEGKTGM